MARQMLELSALTDDRKKVQDTRDLCDPNTYIYSLRSIHNYLCMEKNCYSNGSRVGEAPSLTFLFSDIYIFKDHVSLKKTKQKPTKQTKTNTHLAQRGKTTCPRLTAHEIQGCWVS